MEIKFGITNEIITPLSGLYLVGLLLKKTNLKKRLNESRQKNALHLYDIVASYVGLLCQGKSDFENIESHREDSYFKMALGLNTIPAAPTLRQRMDDTGNKISDLIFEENINLIKNSNAEITDCFNGYIPLDIDVTPFDNSNSNKEGVSYTYKKFVGYAPIIAYLGEEGYCINVELREGKTHCQENTDKFLAQTIQYVRKITSEKILVRMDSGNDSINNILECDKENIDYIIKRNLRKEPLENWLKIAEENASEVLSTVDKEEFLGSTTIKRKEIDKPLKVIFHVKKIYSEKGQMLLIPKIEVDTFWTSLDFPPKRIIELYELHGKSEQFHSELKTELDIERMPSGKFETNSLVLQLAMFAYNILRIIGQESLKKDDAPLRNKVQRRRIKTVIKNIIYMASKLVKSSRYFIVKFSKECMWNATFNRIKTALIT